VTLALPSSFGALGAPSPPPPEYPSAAISWTHPARLRAWASVHGVGVWSGEAFRYLEIGCGDAANLLPIAAQFPRAELVGVDLDAAAIARGRRAAEAAGIRNVRLVAADLRDFALDAVDVGPPGGAPFDYVVCHGVYSWVPPDAQERILALAREALAPLGVAYVSYNTYPGWGVRRVIRDVMRDAAGGEGWPVGLRAAKARLGELKRRMVASDHPYNRMLAGEIDLALRKSDGYLIGEHLAEVNEPCYVKDFLARAARHELAFVWDMVPATHEGDVEAALVADLLASGTSRADAEQMLDVITFRQFRGTLLCHAGVPVAPQPALGPLAEAGFFSAMLTPQAEEPLLGPGKRLAFRTESGVIIESDRPLLKAALLVLSEAWPAGMRPQTLVAASLASLRERGLVDPSSASEALIRETMSDLLALVRRRLVEILPWAPRLAAEVPARPVARPLVRVEAELSPVVTCPTHEPMSLEEPIRTVIRLLDGTRDARALVAELSSRADAGELPLPPGLDGQARAAHLAGLVAKVVGRIRGLGLLQPEVRSGEGAQGGGA
jgi:SAM-dependent methyltransferase